jgi:amino acid transporter
MTFFRTLTRRQVNNQDIRNTSNSLIESDNDELHTNESNDYNNNNDRLERNLNLPSLVFLNISNSIGSGIYVLTGIASRDFSGPYVTLSYLMSGLACLLSALCFAEFASIVKQASGSCYSFVYFSLGEFIAFIIGWLNFISSLASIAATSITWSSYLDSMTNHAISNFTINKLHLKWNIGIYFSDHLDIAAILVLIIIYLIAFRGLTLTTMFNNTIAIANIILLLTISIAGFVFGKFDNLTKTPYQNGFDGVIKGSSVVMYAFLGFESSTYAIGEAKNPSYNVPVSLFCSVAIINLVYCGASLALNLMVPFDQIDVHASYPNAFQNIKPMFWIVSFGPILSLTGTLVSSIYSTDRCAYTMSKDGLLFKYLSYIHKTTKIPYLATLTSLIICIFLIVAIDIKDLIGFTDISAFLIYSTVAMSLLIVRYYHNTSEYINDRNNNISNRSDLAESAFQDNINESAQLLPNDSINYDSNINSNETKSRFRCNFFQNRTNSLLIIVYIFYSNVLFFGLINNLHSKSVTHLKLIIAIIMATSNFLATIILYLFKQKNHANTNGSFKVPFVPLIPVLVIIANTYLMMASDTKEWIIFIILLVLGKYF